MGYGVGKMESGQILPRYIINTSRIQSFVPISRVYIFNLSSSSIAVSMTYCSGSETHLRVKQGDDIDTRQWNGSEPWTEIVSNLCNGD